MAIFSKRPILKIALLAIILIVVTNRRATAQAFWDTVFAVISLSGQPLFATHAVLSEHEIERINAMSPQHQAEELLQRALNRYDGATELIEERVDTWTGELEFTDQFNQLTTVGYESADLRIRAAALELSLAAYGYPKTPESAQQLLTQVRARQGDMVNNLWVLGLLANRDIERQQIIQELTLTVRDPDAKIRRWSIEALGKTGATEVIPTLTDVFLFEEHPWLKERAACNLADGGMFTKEQRLRAVPAFLRMADDPALDAQAHRWAFQALREITGQWLQNDAEAWRDWAADQQFP